MMYLFLTNHRQGVLTSSRKIAGRKRWGRHVEESAEGSSQSRRARRRSPASCAVTPEPLAAQTLWQAGGANEAAGEPDVQGARISRSRGRLPPASRAVQHRDRERTLGQGWLRSG